MAVIGQAIMLESVAPGRAVELAQSAQRYGFGSVMYSDRFAPWTNSQGQASFVWNVASAASAQTTIPINPGVISPSYRMHPAVVAQASATLASIFPDRHWLGIGAGELINEHVTGQYWPEPPTRINRMFSAIEIIRKLFTGREARHSDPELIMEQARLWTLPDRPPRILVATAGPVTARRAGAVADGMITEGGRLEQLATLFEQLRTGATRAGRDPDRLYRVVRLHHAWAETEPAAEQAAIEHWPGPGVRYPVSEVRNTRDFEQLARRLRREDFADRMIISSDLDAHRRRIQQFLDLGVDEVQLHLAGPDPERAQAIFGTEVLPTLSRS